jgi:hypothetical protein
LAVEVGWLRNLAFIDPAQLPDHLVAGIWGLYGMFHNMSYANPGYSVARLEGL